MFSSSLHLSSSVSNCHIGLAGTIVLRSGRLSDLISQLQELISGVNEAEISPDNYDSALLATQVLPISRCCFI